jgi:serine/threonine-protein kinase
MPGDPRVQCLVEELLESELTPEEVCQDCPELLDAVRDRLRRVRALDAQVESMFPSSGSVSTPPRPPDGKPRELPGYEVQAMLGRGGMGVVYKACHLRLKRILALKMLLTGAYAGPRERARFQREAQAVANLRHPGIVRVYDVGEHDGCPFFTMELLDGGSLAQFLAGTPQPAQQAATLLITLAEAVQVAHQAGIVHRDLKPANILLTAEGTPKVADFGLARPFAGASELTLSGVRIGTPSYMAPEQVAGKAGRIGPAADIYALGAILYEMLTGRPPFRGETAAETERQVVHDEPVPPSRLNTKVPRDLETICLKCLSKEPRRRFASAAALADDLGRFAEGRPIQARPVGRAERLLRWCRRNPTVAALAVTALALVALATSGGVWLVQQAAQRRAERARLEGRQAEVAKAALEKTADLEKQGGWPAARAVLDGALTLLETSGPADLRERLRRARVDIETAAELEEIRLSLSGTSSPDRTAARSAEHLYADAFRKYGIDVKALEPADAAARVRHSAIRETLLAFLHDWLYWAPVVDRDPLRALLDRADDDGWRRAYRGALAVKDPRKLRELAAAPEAPAQPPVVLSGLGGLLLEDHPEEALALLREAQQRNPGDFWINCLLGRFLENRPHEAVAYFRAAVAIRPSSDQAYVLLGKALLAVGDSDGAIAVLRGVRALNPSRFVAADLAKALAPRGGLEEARAAWEDALKRDSRDFRSWHGYAPLCLFLGKDDAYRRARQAMLERFEDNTEEWYIAERNSVACLLLPAFGEELRRAAALVDRAVKTGPKFPDPSNLYVQFIRGLAEYRQGRPRQAVPSLEESAALLPNRPGPRLALAMAQFQSGSKAEAKKTLAAAVQAYNWIESQADHPLAWVGHALRREAEALILPDLPAFLRGEYEPHDNDERLALVGACQCGGRYQSAARLYAAAFTADPDLADNLATECRYRSLREEPWSERVESINTEARCLAARCAALAGCGRGRDGAGLSPAEQAQWRKQARAWLRADLALWEKTLASGTELDLGLAKRMLDRWQWEPDLAAIRDLSALRETSAEERTECLALWDEVVAVLRRIAVQQRAIVLDSKLADPRRGVPTELMRQGRLEEARVAWQTALEGNPLDHNAWYGYAELCLFLGREDEYRRARRDLLARFFITDNPYFAERTGRACLLMPAMGDELRQAVVLARRAAAADPAAHGGNYSWFLFARGLAEYREGKFDQAISTMRGGASSVSGPLARIVLAMALHRDGQLAEARTTLAAAIRAFDWTANQARDVHPWICHLLRREAEGLIVPNLPAFRRGEYRGKDHGERVALLAGQLASCEFEGLQVAAARLYSDAFAAEPTLAEDVLAAVR